MSKSATPAPTELLKLDNQLCFPLYAVSRLFTKAYQPLLQELELTYPQYLVMLLLWEHQELSVKELGDKLLLDSGTLTPLLKRMEQRQLLSRRRDSRDERSVLITLLPAGNGMQQRAQCIPEALLAKLQLSPEEFSQLRNTLNQLLTQLS
jgi:DNA-binding MarR family transcriptional regulator